MGVLELLIAGAGKLLALALPYIGAYLAGRNQARADSAEIKAQIGERYAEILANARPGDAVERLRRGEF